MQLNTTMTLVAICAVALGLSACMPTAYELEEWVEYPHTITDPKEPEATGGGPVEIDADLTMAESAQISGPGELEADEIDQVFEARSNLLLDCYRQSVVSQQAGEGTLRLRFELPSSGYARNVRAIENELGDQTGRCIVDAVSDWAFPAPVSEPVTVEKEIELTTEEP